MNFFSKHVYSIEVSLIKKNKQTNKQIKLVWNVKKKIIHIYTCRFQCDLKTDLLKLNREIIAEDKKIITYSTSSLVMFKLKLNLSLINFLKELRNQKIISNEELIDLIDIQESISVHTFLELYGKYQEDQSSKDKPSYDIKHLLTPLEFQFKPQNVPGSNYSPEFRQHLDNLRCKLREKEYQEMIKSNSTETLGLGNSVDDSNTPDLTPSQINKQIKEQVTTVFNILLSVVSVIVAIWYWSGSSSRFPVEIRILLCLFFGLLVLLAEVVVYNGYLQRLNEAKTKEKSKKERKKVIKTIKIGANRKIQ